ncbi:AAA family ATPase [Candidatus Woesearchaeota archaeon]|nr:AAA family ATPase [Candidatus Woesearchaeota archaeon]
MGKVIGIISIKGGVGKTTTTLNLGAVIAHEFGKKVLVADANYSAPNLGLHLGIVDPKTTMHHVLLKSADIKDAIYEHDDNLHVLPGSLINKRVSPHILKEKLKDIKDDYDIILLDSSPTLNDEILSTMIASDKLLVVTTPDYPTLSTTLRAVKLAKQKKTPIAGLIMNKVKKKKFELTLDDIEETADVPVLAVLPDDVKMLEALSETKHIAEHSPKREIAYEYRHLGSCLLGEDYKDPRFRKKMRSLFKRDFPKHEVNRLQARDNLKANWG